MGISASQYKLLVGRGELREIEFSIRAKRLPYAEAERFVRERMSRRDQTLTAASATGS